VEEGCEFAASKGMPFYQISAKSHGSVVTVFQEIASTLVSFDRGGREAIASRPAAPRSEKVAAFPLSDTGKRSETMLNCLVVGDRGVGKRRLVSGFLVGEFTSAGGPGEMDAPRSGSVLINGEMVRLRIRTCSGLDSSQSLRNQDCCANAVIVVYDATNDETYQHVPRWCRVVSEIPVMTNRQVPMFIVQNKTDLISEREVIPVARKRMGKSRVFFHDISVARETSFRPFRDTVLQTMLEEVKSMSTPVTKGKRK
jgi:GTPase SAR1 family protein